MNQNSERYSGNASAKQAKKKGTMTQNEATITDYFSVHNMVVAMLPAQFRGFARH
jgi:hypothetical protein